MDGLINRFLPFYPFFFFLESGESSHSSHIASPKTSQVKTGDLKIQGAVRKLRVCKHGHQQWMAFFFSNQIHPGNLKRYLRIRAPWERKIIFQTIIFRFYVNLPGCFFLKWGCRKIWKSSVSKTTTTYHDYHHHCHHSCKFWCRVKEWGRIPWAGHWHETGIIYNVEPTQCIQRISYMNIGPHHIYIYIFVFIFIHTYTFIPVCLCIFYVPWFIYIYIHIPWEDLDVTVRDPRNKWFHPKPAISGPYDFLGPQIFHRCTITYCMYVDEYKSEYR